MKTYHKWKQRLLLVSSTNTRNAGIGGQGTGTNEGILRTK